LKDKPPEGLFFYVPLAGAPGSDAGAAEALFRFWWRLRAVRACAEADVTSNPGVRERVLALLEPLVEGLGYELVDLEWHPGRREGTLRVFIDLAGAALQPAGPAERHVGVEDCERVSREVSALMDVEDPIPMGYALEVSSPGFDRVLRKPAHYERFVGSRVWVELIVPRDGRRRYTGVLSSAAADGIELQVDGQPVQIAYRDVGRARLAS
jgi:ribosome maturation factor RimP